MKKVISFVAAAALLGGMVTTAHAASVTTKGDTDISLYGDIRTDFTWSKKANNEMWPVQAYKKTSGTSAEKAQSNKISFHAGAWTSLIGLDLENKDIGVSGKIEGDFSGGDNNQLKLLQAYLKHDLGNNVFFLVGKTANILSQATSSLNWDGAAGFYTTPDNSPQIRIGGEFDLGSVTLVPEIALEEFKDEITEGDSTKFSFNRNMMPGIGGKLTAAIKTPFGEPINVYGGYSYEQVKLDVGGKEKKKSPQVATAGISVPISWMTLSANYNYMKGSTAFSGLCHHTPPSFYIEGGSAKPVKGQSYNAEVNISPIEQASMWLGYAQVKFKNIDKLFSSGTLSSDKEVVKKDSEWYMGLSYALSKATTVSMEYDLFKTTYHNGSNSRKDKGSLFITSFSYSF